MQRALVAMTLLTLACSEQQSAPDDLRILLTSHTGDSELDRRVAKAQAEIRAGRAVVANLEKLGRLWIGKARTEHDPGYYKLAEQCAGAIESRQPGDHGARLLRGHVLQSLHRFAEAETIARTLVTDRGEFADHGLLGDVLYDRGDVRGALTHYQRMLDLKPCLQSYVRAAQVRWIRGDHTNAKNLLRLAISAGSARDPEALTWAYARLALVELQSGDTAAADEACARGLQIDPQAANLLLVEARIRAARAEHRNALASAQRAAQSCPLPEHRWLVADLAREAGEVALHDATDAALRRTGAIDDPRHYALYLLSRSRELPLALELAERELQSRQDVFTHDLHAWALFLSGRLEQAHTAITAAQALETDDARIHYHAGAIAAARGDRATAQARFAAAERQSALLWPSERRDLRERAARLGS